MGLYTNVGGHHMRNFRHVKDIQHARSWNIDWRSTYNSADLRGFWNRDASRSQRTEWKAQRARYEQPREDSRCWQGGDWHTCTNLIEEQDIKRYTLNRWPRWSSRCLSHQVSYQTYAHRQLSGSVVPPCTIERESTYRCISNRIFRYFEWNGRDFLCVMPACVARTKWEPENMKGCNSSHLLHIETFIKTHMRARKTKYCDMIGTWLGCFSKTICHKRKLGWKGWG